MRGGTGSRRGDDQAVYAFEREDLERWEAELGVILPNGIFGENLTTVGVGPISVAHRPTHCVMVRAALFAFTIKPQMLEDLLAAGDDSAPALRHEIRTRIESRHQ